MRLGAQLGWKWLNRALQTQIGSYGEYVQHSTNYHRLMLQSVLLVEVVRRGTGLPVAREVAVGSRACFPLALLDAGSGLGPGPQSWRQ